MLPRRVVPIKPVGHIPFSEGLPLTYGFASLTEEDRFPQNCLERGPHLVFLAAKVRYYDLG